MLNIRGTSNINVDDDLFYRYKMHKPNISIGRNNKLFDNIDIISKELDRDPKDMIKYIKTKNGVNINYKNNCAVLPSSFDGNVLLESIYGFIEDCVLCKSCKLPETKIIDKKMVCSCCSYTGKILKL